MVGKAEALGKNSKDGGKNLHFLEYNAIFHQPLLVTYIRMYIAQGVFRVDYPLVSLALSSPHPPYFLLLQGLEIEKDLHQQKIAYLLQPAIFNIFFYFRQIMNKTKLMTGIK